MDGWMGLQLRNGSVTTENIKQTRIFLYDQCVRVLLPFLLVVGHYDGRYGMESSAVCK